MSITTSGNESVAVDQPRMMVHMDTAKLAKTIFSFAVMAFIAFLPPIEPLTEVGMRTIGVFVGTVLLLSLVDIFWPAVLCMPLFALTGVMSLNDTIVASFGSWITMFIVMSFILTYSLNATGFTTRLTAYYMSRKFVSRSPWTFTFALITLGMIAGWFLDPVPTVAFFLGFARKIFKELGYQPTDRYPHMVTMALAFAINIAGGMTPISHPLAILGIGIYQNMTGETINLFTYMLYAVPVGLVIYALMLLMLRFMFKPDFERFKTFDVNKVLGEVKPMDLREKITVSVFFITVFFWILPGILDIITPGLPIVVGLNKLGPAFWALLAVVVLAFVEVNNKPVIDMREAMSTGMSWKTVFLASGAILLGSAVTMESVGLNPFIIKNISPITDALPPMLIVMVITGMTSVMTNFTSNVTTIVLMTGVGVSMALASGGIISPPAIALTTTMVGALAYMVPAAFASIGVLYGDEYSHGGTIFRYGAAMVVVTTVIATFIGYPIARALF